MPPKPRETSHDTVLRLRELRRLRGLSQKDVARLSGIGERTISAAETGQKIDSLKVVQLEKLLAVYGLTPAEFFGERLSDMIEEVPDELSQLTRRAKALPARLRDAVIDRLRVVVASAEEMANA